ncbi:MAG TPA: DUF4276 family protein [Chryseolinea sp.]|nr:DUF4276 family protein [Chryseolinea sp.]
MRNIVFFLEEPSAQEMLKVMLPRMINPDEVSFRYVVFEGKSDLEKNIERKIRAWKQPDTRFVILRDQDSGDCRLIKQRLLSKCQSVSESKILVRIACRELESWYLGDLLAVEKGLEIPNLAKYQTNKKFRNPDNLNNASEELHKLTSKRYQKVAGSRKIGKHLSLQHNQSHSFQVFIKGLKRLLS